MALTTDQQNTLLQLMAQLNVLLAASGGTSPAPAVLPPAVVAPPTVIQVHGVDHIIPGVDARYAAGTPGTVTLKSGNVLSIAQQSKGEGLPSYAYRVSEQTGGGIQQRNSIGMWFLGYTMPDGYAQTSTDMDWPVAVDAAFNPASYETQAQRDAKVLAAQQWAAANQRLRDANPQAPTVSPPVGDPPVIEG